MIKQTYIYLEFIYSRIYYCRSPKFRDLFVHF